MKFDDSGDYSFEIGFSEVDKQISYWYWNNWPEGEDVAELAAKYRAADNSDSPWKQSYIDYIHNHQGEGWSSYHIIYINEDEIPELYLVGESTAQGDLLCTYSNGTINSVMISNYGLSYIERQNLFCNTGGRMDSYYDIVYNITKGEIVELHQGEYGAEDNSNVQMDEDGLPIYSHSWDGNTVSEDDYQNQLNSVYDTSRAVIVLEDQNSADEIIQQIQDIN